MPLLRRVIGAVLRRVRLRQRRTLREVAQQAGVSLAYLSEIERGRKEASSEVLAAICRALGLRLADLMAQVHEELVRLEPAIPPLLPRRPGGVPMPPGAWASPRPWPLAGHRANPSSTRRCPSPAIRHTASPLACHRSRPAVRYRSGLAAARRSDAAVARRPASPVRHCCGPFLRRTRHALEA